jgi:hypothetical protein
VRGEATPHKVILKENNENRIFTFCLGMYYHRIRSNEGRFWKSS